MYKEEKCPIGHPCKNCDNKCCYLKTSTALYYKGQDEKENENERITKKHEEGNQLHPH